jgi:GTP cyclohydrolase I (EC 3.5.4.16)
VAGFSKSIRLVKFHASKPQLQHWLVVEIADAFMATEVAPKGVMVIGDAIHKCAYVRGVKDKEAKLVSTAMRGVFKTNRSLRNHVFRLLEISKGKNGNVL